MSFGEIAYWLRAVGEYERDVNAAVERAAARGGR
jgi:hypothetical protein